MAVLTFGALSVWSHGSVNFVEHVWRRISMPGGLRSMIERLKRSSSTCADFTFAPVVDLAHTSRSGIPAKELLNCRRNSTHVIFSMDGALRSRCAVSRGYVSFSRRSLSRLSEIHYTPTRADDSPLVLRLPKSKEPLHEDASYLAKPCGYDRSRFAAPQ